MKVLNTNLKQGRNYWLLAEKIIGIILLIWSAIVLYNIIYVIAGVVRSDYTSRVNISYTSIAVQNHLTIILGILCLFGSCMLLYKDKTGWMLCVITSLLYGISLFLSASSKSADGAMPMSQYYKSYSAAALLFFIIFILLVLTPIRKKYQPTLKTWIIIGLAILLFIIDRSLL